VAADHCKVVCRYIRLVVIKFCGVMGFFLAGIHALSSLSLLAALIALTPLVVKKRLTDKKAKG
jgi:hypothetical protein